jgi:myosin heavy subunit
MELNFTPEAKIKGCRIVNYLLEKSRVVWQIPNERNYHVFYMMINDDKLKSKLKLGAASQYHYLNQSGCEVVKGRNDAEVRPRPENYRIRQESLTPPHSQQEHADMIRAMNDLEFKDETQSDIFAGLAGILNLGNISYDELSNTSGEDQVQIANKDYLLQACSHLGLDKTDVDKALCFRRMETREGVIQIPLNVKQAQDLRDAMAKEIYRLIFDFLVRRVNETIFNGPGESGLSIGVLDIFGFELFEVNSFEQLCINYANEKLQ